MSALAYSSSTPPSSSAKSLGAMCQMAWLSSGTGLASKVRVMTATSSPGVKMIVDCSGSMRGVGPNCTIIF